MTNTYNTGNPLGSTDARDLYDNASNMDEGMNSGTPSFTDRLGVLRKTWNGLEAEFDLAQTGRETEFQQFLTDSGFTSLGNYAAGLNFTLYNQYMARDGFFYRPAPSSIPFTTTGTWVGGDENLFVLLSPDDVLRQDLASTTDPLKGSGQIGFDAALAYSAGTAGAAIKAALDSGAYKVFSFEGYGAVDDSVTDSTAACQAAINAAIAVGGTLDISGNYAVTSVTIQNASGLRITGRGSLVGIAAVATPCVLDARNVINVAVDGAWFINGAYNTNYTSAFWAYTDGVGQAAAFLDFTNVSPVNAKIGWRFGSPARPDDLVSEINIRGGMTSGCPVAVEATGLQTVINFSGTTLLSSYGDGDAGWQTLPQKTVVAVGATIHINGGELVHPAISAGTLCEIQPLTGGSGTLYGNISVTGAVCEPACPLATTSNPATLASPLKGCIQFTNCNGVHTQDAFGFVQTDSTFIGRLQFANNYFHATVARTQPNIQCGAACDVFCDDVSFGPNFLPAVSGIVGGVVHFSERMVLNVNNLNGITINNGSVTDLRFATVVQVGNLARFSAQYNPATGVFTVPTGGLKNIRIETQFLKGGLVGEWYVQITGTNYGVRTLGTYNQNSYSIDSLAAGDTIKIVALNTGGVLTAGTAVTDWFQIFASA